MSNQLTQTTQDWGLPPEQALGTAAGLVIGLAIAWAVVGAALASAPVFAATVSITLATMVIGQRIGAKQIDLAFILAIAILTIVLVGATVGI